MTLDHDELAEAVFVFAGNRLKREMLYGEFEALLDGYVPVPEFANQQVKAVFLRINQQLAPVAAVFFLVDFDAQGFPDRRWNLPLAQLADSAARGPDLGVGAIKLACFSQCPIAYHQQGLWDPDMTPGHNNFIQIKKALRQNRLGLVFRAKPRQPGQVELHEDFGHSAQALKRRYETEARDHIARLLKEQRLRLATQKNQFQEQVNRLKGEHQQRLARYQEALTERDEQLRQLQANNASLKDRLESQAVKLEGLRDYFEHKLKSTQAGEQESIQSLQKQYEMELQIKVEAAVAELEEMVQMRDMELLYRNEQEASLNDEIARLRQELQSLVGNTGEEILQRLSQSGISFVAYHAGAGHITVPLADLSRYTENPQDYAAAKCGLTPGQYRDWLEHYQHPVCRALTSKGSPCGIGIDRVHNPADFHPGENDRCAEHRALVPSGLALN